MLTPEVQEKLVQYLASHELARGVGSEESACSVAAINLALTGKLTDKIPDCMSLVIGRWIIVVQDAMPARIRNSSEWKNLLPLSAGTGRVAEREQARLSLILEWMWKCMEDSQPLAESHGFGVQWLQMTEAKTTDAARAAYAAAAAAAADAADAAAYADYARAAAAAAAAAAAYADYARAAYADADEFWNKHSPISLLEKLCEV